MPIIFGAGLSYSPLMYRPRAAWSDLARLLIGETIQPASRASEDAALLDSYEQRIERSFEVLVDSVRQAELDAVIVLYTDRGSAFDHSNVPQLHLQVGGEVWGDTSIGGLDEAPRRVVHSCDENLSELLIEELVAEGFDVSEARAAFRPVGRPQEGASSALMEAISKIGVGLPIVPIHVNCHIEPTLPGRRLCAFGRALSDAAALTDRRVGVLVTGGLSGDPRGPMAGWIDDVLDQWVLTRLTRSQPDELAKIWSARSRTLNGNSAELRLWTVAAAAFEQARCQARVVDYLPMHHAATGIAFVQWEK